MVVMSGRQSTHLGYGVILALASFSSSSALLRDEDQTGQRLQAPPLSRLSQLGGRYITVGDVSYKAHTPKYLGSNVCSFAVSPDGSQIAFFTINSDSTSSNNAKNLNKFTPIFSIAQSTSGTRKDFPLSARQAPLFYMPEERFINNYAWVNNNTLLVDSNEETVNAHGTVSERRVAYIYSSSTKSFTRLSVTLNEDSEIYLSETGRTNSVILNWGKSGSVSVTVLNPQLNVVGDPIEMEPGWIPSKKLQGESLIFWRDPNDTGKASEWLELNIATGEKNLLNSKPVSHDLEGKNSETPKMSLIEHPLPVDEGVPNINTLYLSVMNKEYFVDSASRVSCLKYFKQDIFVFTITATGDLKSFRFEPRTTSQVMAEQSRYMFYEEAAAKLRSFGANISQINDTNGFPTMDQISNLLKEQENFGDLKAGKASIKLLLNEIPGGGLEIMSLSLNGDSARLVFINGKYDVLFTSC